MTEKIKATPVTPDELLATAMYNRKTNINKLFTDIKEDNVVDGDIVDRRVEDMRYSTFYQKVKPRSGNDIHIPMLLYLLDYLGYAVLVQDLENPEKIYSLYSENDPL